MTSPEISASRREPFAAVPSALVGREAELIRLQSCLERASRGERQIVFITGEPGIGKSTLVSYFIRHTVTRNTRLLNGRSVEHYGTPEPYYSILYALADAAKTETIPDLIPILRRYAPTWLDEMPGLVSPAEVEGLKQEVIGATRDRMVREMMEVLQVLSADHPLILVLEDLHWSDVSTLDLISSIANRVETSRLLLLATYRPVDAILSNHPVKDLKRDLLARRQCVELPLEPLRKEHVHEWIQLRFPNGNTPPQFLNMIYVRTDGNPLFVSTVLEHAAECCFLSETGGWRWKPGTSIEIGVPESLSKMIEAQVDKLSYAERQALELASVMGFRFALMLIPAQPGETIEWEEIYDCLARRELIIQAAGISEIARECLSPAYQFKHELYRDVIYKRLSPAQRIRLHRSVGERLETVAAEVKEVASELALHFEECRDYDRAIRYLQMAAQRTAQRHALAEALDLFTRALNLCERLADTKRIEAELEVVEQIGLLYRLMGRLADAAVQFERMFEKAHREGVVSAQLRAQLCLASVTSWLDRSRCLKAVDTALALCSLQTDPYLRINAEGQAAYWNLLFRGWSAQDARTAVKALEAARQTQDQAHMALHGNRQSFFFALASQYEDACQMAEEGIRLAIRIESLVDYSVGQFFEAWALLHLGHWGRMHTLLNSGLELADKNGHSFWTALFGLLQAFLHLEALSFPSARQISEQYLSLAKAIGHELSIQIGLILLGLSELGCHNLIRARQCLTEVHDWHKRQRILMDWIWQMPLQRGLTELALVSGDLPTARSEAKIFLSLTSVTAERTWTALAHYEEALVALAAQDHAMARHHVSEGLELIQGRQAPLAAWRLHALAAGFDGEAQHRSLAQSIIADLGASLTEHEQLKQTFVSSATAALTNFAPVIKRPTAGAAAYGSSTSIR